MLVPAHTGLRGLLALWLVLFHSLFYSAGWNLHGSALMPVFFLLSGYSLAASHGSAAAISPSAIDARQQRSRVNLKSFYWNRLVRIAPIYYMGMLIALPLCISGHGWIQRVELGRVLATNLFALQMWVPHPATFARSLDGPAWTVSTLVLFYLVFPWILRRREGQTDRALNRSIMVLMAIQAVVFFALYYGVSRVFDANAGFWVAHAWPVSRLPVFEMGVVAGLLALRQGGIGRAETVKLMGVSSARGAPWARQVDRCAGTFAFLLLGLSSLHVLTGIDLGGSFWMQGVFPFALLQIIVGLSMTDRDGVSSTARLLSWPPLLFLGRISMPLYLVHEPIIQYVAWIARPEAGWAQALPTPMPLWGTLIVLPASLVLAVLLERLVERPARRLLRGHTS